MMASFLPVIKEQTNREKYVFYCSVSQIHINPGKKHEKPHHIDCFNLPICSLYMFDIVFSDFIKIQKKL